MKKILALLTIFTLALSCGKEGGNTDEPSGGSGGSGGGGSTKEIESITLPSSTLLISVEMAEGKVLPVTLAPEGCNSTMLNVTLSEEGIVSWSAGDGGILFKPLKIGQVEATIRAKSGAATSKKATIKVLSAEDYASVAISKIEIQSSVALLNGDSSGKIVSVKLTPSEASTDMLKWSGGEDYVTVSAVAGGLKFVPKKLGSTTVKIEARKGSAAAVNVAVEVLSPESFSEYVITGITWSPSTIEVRDNETVDVTLGLTPSDATVADISVSSKNGAIATVSKGSGKVIRISGKSPGETKIIVSGLRDGSVTKEIPVKVYGHVTSISISPATGLEVVKGKSTILTAVIQKTGTLMSENVEWSTDDGEKVSLNADKQSCSVSGKIAGGASAPVKITASLEGKSVTVDFCVYDYATSIDASVSGVYEDESSAYNLKVYKTFNVSWKVLPATAKQDAEIQVMFASSSTTLTSYATITTVASGDRFLTSISPTKTSTDKLTLSIQPVNKASSGKGYSKSLYFNDYLSSDVKPGDFVYYNSSEKRFYWSDGGFRCKASYSVRVVSKSQQTSLGTLVAQVYDENVPTGDAAFNKLSCPGFANKSGAHACVLSVDVANEYGSSVDYWRWSEDYDDVYAQTDWKGGPYPLTGGQTGQDYSMKLNINYYNGKSGGSHKIKPGYVVTSYDKVTFGTISDYSTLGHTGWMLPLRSTARDKIVAFSSNECYKKVFFAMNNWKLVSETITPWEKDYWTAEQYDKDNAYFFNFVQTSYKNKGNSLYNWDKPYVRPILWL